MFVVLVRQDFSIAASAVGQLLMTQPKAATVGAARILTPPSSAIPKAVACVCSATHPHSSHLVVGQHRSDQSFQDLFWHFGPVSKCLHWHICEQWRQHEKLKSMQVNGGLQMTHEVRRS